jgi:hypothetical protein
LEPTGPTCKAFDARGAPMITKIFRRFQDLGQRAGVAWPPFGVPTAHGPESSTLESSDPLSAVPRAVYLPRPHVWGRLQGLSGLVLDLRLPG